MPPDWRLFHVRRSTGKRLFFEVPLNDLLKCKELLNERRSALISAAVTGQIDVRGLVPEVEAS